MAGNQILGTVYGTQAISTFTVISRIQTLPLHRLLVLCRVYSPCLGLTGAGKYRQGKENGILALRFVLIYGGLISLGLYAGAPYIIRLFPLMRMLCWRERRPCRLSAGQPVPEG